MNTIETILNRRSVRKYESKQIPDEDMRQILSCGDAGPSGANNRGWRFIIVQDADYRKMLVEKGMPLYRKWLQNMPENFREMRAEIDKTPDPIYYGAPAVVFVIGKGMTADYDCAMTCQNMMLAARSLGIGSCWVHIGQLVLQDQSVKDDLKIVEGEKVYGPVVFGYPLNNEFPPKPDFQESSVLWK